MINAVVSDMQRQGEEQRMRSSFDPPAASGSGTCVGKKEAPVWQLHQAGTGAMRVDTGCQKTDMANICRPRMLDLWARAPRGKRRQRQRKWPSWGRFVVTPQNGRSSSELLLWMEIGEGSRREARHPLMGTYGDWWAREVH